MANTDEFRAVVGKWAKKTVPEQLLGVARIAIQDTAEEVINLTNVDTGFLVGNWQPSFEAPILAIDEAGTGNGYAASKVGLIISDLKLGDTFFMTNNAVYARRINYGFVGKDSLGRYYNQAGTHMIETAVGNWPSVVERAAAVMAG